MVFADKNKLWLSKGHNIFYQTKKTIIPPYIQNQKCLQSEALCVLYTYVG